MIDRHLFPSLRALPAIAGLSVLVLAVWMARAADVQFAPAITVVMDGEPLRVEVADTLPRRKRGLQGRAALADGRGMLFVYPQPRAIRLWMKDTLINLDVAFFDGRGHWLASAQMRAGELRIHASPDTARFALELPAGWLRAHGVGPGSRLRAPGYTESQ